MLIRLLLLLAAAQGGGALGVLAPVGRASLPSARMPLSRRAHMSLSSTEPTAWELVEQRDFGALFEQAKEEPSTLLGLVKDAGVAGAISYTVVELVFWAIALPIGIFSWHASTGEWLQPLLLLQADGVEGKARLLGLLLSYVLLLKTLFPVRLGSTLLLTPYTKRFVDSLPIAGADAQPPAGGASAASRPAQRRSSGNPLMQLVPSGGKRLLVLGGSGFVGREVCRNAVACGYEVTSLSRRGVSPDPSDSALAQVDWVSGDANDAATIEGLVAKADAVVHAIGLLFDVESGLSFLSPVVSYSNSQPGAESTYDNMTRKTALTAIAAAKKKAALPAMLGRPMPFAFVSCAEAGWPDVPLGEQVEAVSPEWLKKYLAAKRAVESELMEASTGQLRPVIARPSLIWNWRKLDVLPVIPIFNAASALGVPFVDKTVRVEDLGKAIVAGLRDGGVSGVQRYPEIEALAATEIPGL